MTTQLRFIERNGKKILQSLEAHDIWHDVPTYVEDQPTVTITREQFREACRGAHNLANLTFGLEAMQSFSHIEFVFARLAEWLGLGD